eukprot:CAMPEP_0197322574 /NCGR_PEP_ID=MMETSP0891-20130614/69983_1 /TAXON_ID=44058 ORGANISM="Aureoumbra lagunensis, Strain CCMP1510" /NCGR_SAMPLE_ID=MMETSP0891 /ASSEMBLY_ACC=CAM_ASM_000534 /LENGTH=820 /DNA_ID=CAMNT_0042815003 /DNA_START=2533 /DNA_END=4995 /DNA_ORIENTATION=-
MVSLVKVFKARKKKGINRGSKQQALPRGILLTGLPGVGKTSLARAFANDIAQIFEVNKVRIFPSDCQSAASLLKSLKGKGAEAINAMYDEAEQYYKESGVPVVVFLDEIDAVASTQKSNFDADNSEIVNTLNPRLDKASQRGVLTIAATNFPSRLMHNFKSRFEIISVDPPDMLARYEIAKKQFDSFGDEFFGGENKDETKCKLSDKLASITRGFSGRDILTVINNVYLNAEIEQAEDTDESENNQVFSRIEEEALRKAVATRKKESISQAEYTYPNRGGTYSGSWLLCQRSGKGKHEYSDGSLYDGYWENDRRCGSGTFVSSDKTWKYEGHWKDDRIEGQGTFSIKQSGDPINRVGFFTTNKVVDSNVDDVVGGFDNFQILFRADGSEEYVLISTSLNAEDSTHDAVTGLSQKFIISSQGRNEHIELIDILCDESATDLLKASSVLKIAQALVDKTDAEELMTHLKSTVLSVMDSIAVTALSMSRHGQRASRFEKALSEAVGFLIDKQATSRLSLLAWWQVCAKDIVSQLKLEFSKYKQVQGDISSLSKLKALQSLNLSGCNQLEGNILSLKELTALQTLNLSGCRKLKGDKGDISSLSNLTALQTLNLSGCNQLQGEISDLSQLIALQTLDLSGCEQLQGNISSLSPLTALQILSLAFCEQLQGDISNLRPLTALQTLALTGCNQLEGNISSLSELTALQTLHLTGCKQLQGDISRLSKLAALRILYLIRCNQLRGDISSLSPLTALEHINLLGCNQLQGNISSLSPLKKLQYLDLSECKLLQGNISSLLSELTALRIHDFSGCNLLKGSSPMYPAYS